jgi:hypothetical protein
MGSRRAMPRLTRNTNGAAILAVTSGKTTVSSSKCEAANGAGKSFPFMGRYRIFFRAGATCRFRDWLDCIYLDNRGYTPERFAHYGSLSASGLSCKKFQFKSLPALGSSSKHIPRPWCVRTANGVRRQTYIQLKVYDRVTMSSISRPETPARKVSQVKGPIRCHKCQLVCRDGAEYLSHKCVPRPNEPEFKEPLERKYTLSFRTGDRSRCERLRKQKRVMRERNRELRKTLEAKKTK